MSVYENEDSVGVAIRESGLDRKELYITTKYDGGDVREEIEKSLKKVYLYIRHISSMPLMRFASLVSVMSIYI